MTCGQTLSLDLVKVGKPIRRERNRLRQEVGGQRKGERIR